MKTKNLWMGTALLLAAFCCHTPTVQAQTEKTPSVDVQATAQREVMPDELLLSIEIRENDYKGRVSLLEKQNEMIAVLKRLHIDYEENLSIRQMGSEAKFKTFSRNPVPRSEATYHLKLHDAATLQQVVRQLEDQHITHINLVQTRYTRADELKVELGAEAARKAKKEAAALAAAVDQSIGKALSINSWMTNNSPRPRVYKLAMAEAYNADASEGADIPTPNITGITYVVNVSAKFELK